LSVSYVSNRFKQVALTVVPQEKAVACNTTGVRSRVLHLMVSEL